MRSTPILLFRSSSCLFKDCLHHGQSSPIVTINNGTFYRKYPSPADKNTSENPPLFPNLTFSFPSFPAKPQHWAVLGPSNAGKTTLFEILRGQHLCFPPNARSYPYLSSPEIGLKDPRLRVPSRAIDYVGFNGEGGGIGRSGTRGAYLSARYESRREDTDFSVMSYLRGNTELNPSGGNEKTVVDEDWLSKIVKDLRLEALITMPMGNLSNGQIRRTRIAKALLSKPELILLDEPFSTLYNSLSSNDRSLMHNMSVGLDPPTLTLLSPLLHDLAKIQSLRLILALRPQDPLPGWITHVLYLGPNFKVDYQGQKANLPEQLRPLDDKHLLNLKNTPVEPMGEAKQATIPRDNVNGRDSTVSWKAQDPSAKPPAKPPNSSFNREGIRLHDPNLPDYGEPLVEMENVLIKYREKQMLGGWTQNGNDKSKQGLLWTVRRGERWGIFGPNGRSQLCATFLLSPI